MNRSPTDTLSCRVLVVDDNQDDADLLAVLLTEMGHECQAVYSSEEAESIVLDFEPHVLLLDLALPKKSGLALGKDLKVRFPTCLLIAISGYSDDSVIDQAKKAGFDHYFVKPAEIERLAAILDEARSHLSLPESAS